MNVDEWFLVVVVVILLLITYVAWSYHVGKILVAGGIASQIVGFFLMLYSRTTYPVKDKELFNKIFYLSESALPEVEGPTRKYWPLGAWLVIGGLSVNLTGLFLF